MSDQEHLQPPSPLAASSESTAVVAPTNKRSELRGAALTLVFCLLLIDTAVETFLSGAQVRWWVAGAVAVFLVLIAGAWSGVLGNRFSWSRRATAAFFVLLGLLATTVWLPDGLNRGVAMLRQPTSVVLSTVSALAVAAAGLMLVRVTVLPWWGRAALGLVALYGVAAFALGMIESTPYPNLFQGGSLWRRLPYWLQGAFIGTLVAVPLAIVAASVDVFRHLRAADGRGWGLQQSLALALSALIAVSGFTMNAGPALAIVAQGVGGPQPASLLALPEAQANWQRAADPSKLPAVLDALDRFQAAAPQSSFDVAAKAVELGPEVDAIFRFVRDQVRFEVYEGVLRGARGALRGLAGNSFDKSLLLAELLRHHGIGTRFRVGRLTADRSAALVTLMFEQAANLPAASGPSRTEPPELAADAFTDVVSARLVAHVDMVRDALETAQVRPSPVAPVTLAALAAEASEHCWLEYQQAGSWVALDPTSKAGEPDQPPAVSSLTYTQLPASSFHHVVIRERLEERQADRLSVRDVLQHQATTADLDAASVTVRHVITGTADEWSASPILEIDHLQKTGQSFHGGHVSGATGGLDQGAKNLGKRIFGGLSQGRSPIPPQLTAIWLDFEFISPSGSSQSARREILDLIGAAARLEKRESSAPLAALTLQGGVPVALAEVFACSFTAGPVARGYMAQSIQAALPALRSAHRLSDDRTANKLNDASQAELLTILPELLVLMARTFHAHSQSARLLIRDNRVHFYEASPRLAIASLGLEQVTLDLRRNDLRVVSRTQSPSELIWANTLRGILDGVIEHTHGSGLPSADANLAAASAIAVIEKATSDGTPLRAFLTPAQAGNVQAPADARARLAASVSGVVNIAPPRAVRLQDRDRLGWWRVDTRSGETLSVMDTGLHQGGTEWSLGLGRQGWGNLIYHAAWTLLAMALTALVAYVFGYMAGRSDSQIPRDRLPPPRSY